MLIHHSSLLLIQTITTLIILQCITFTQCLTLIERNELARKFKYYFNSVRPIARDNYVSDENGTHFTIETEVHLLNSIRTQNSVSLEAFVLCKFVDDRLILRELEDRFEVTEFEPWQPRITTSPTTSLKTSIFLSPQTGELNIYYRVKETIPCVGDSWRHPFEIFNCDLTIENGGEERLRVVDHRDARPKLQLRQVGLEIEDWPVPLIRLWFRGTWHTTLVSVFLPSFLVFAVVVFAQWKRRKIQVIVTVTALICIVILLSSQRAYPSLTLRDLWLCSTFLHTIFLLIVDLTLPARRVRYTLMVDVNGKPTMASPESSPPTQKATIVHAASSGEEAIVDLVEYDENFDIDRAKPVGWPIKWLKDEDDGWPSPLIGGRRAVMAIQKFAGRTFGQTKVESQVIRGCPGQEVPIHRQITANTLGNRKKFALLAKSNLINAATGGGPEPADRPCQTGDWPKAQASFLLRV
ncbi:unnamed protein product, partial [Mesorhabditis belari]|uniref:Uncharacterized protein n=1 Tax=Mesorhabditis belari TaxID=2138241 RepID=A0AAF3FFR1_9BILA